MFKMLVTARNAALSADRYALVLAIGFGLAAIALTVIGRYDDLLDIILGVGFAGLALFPYVGAVTLSMLRDSMRWAVWTSRLFQLVFGPFDAWYRYQTLWNPQGSTDAVALFTLPVMWAPLLFLASGLSTVVVLKVASLRFRP